MSVFFVSDVFLSRIFSDVFLSRISLFFSLHAAERYGLKDIQKYLDYIGGFWIKKLKNTAFSA